MIRFITYCLLSPFLLGPLGCGSGDASLAPAYQGPPKAGGSLIVATQADGTTLDPHRATDAGSMRLIENMYSTIMRYTPEYGEVEPDLADSVHVSEDGLVYSITLRPDLVFHSGRPVTAEDVKFSIERIIENQVRANHFAMVQRIETPDPHTVKLYLQQPSAPLLTNLAYPMNAIVDRQGVEEAGGDLSATAAGSGPFELVEWRKDLHLKLKRHEAYHVESRPYLDEVIFRPIPDETARSTALRNGEVHLVLDVAAKDVSLIENAAGVVVSSVPGTFWEYIGLNTAKPPLDDVRVRQAIAHAIDRPSLAQLKFGQATVLPGGHIPPNHWAHATGFAPYAQRDVDRARQLLADAGHPDGFSAVMKVGSAFAYQVQASQRVKQQLLDVGIDIEIQSLESGLFFDALNNGDFEMTLVGWLGFVDPDEWTYNLFHTDGSYNQQAYSNPDLDALLERGRRTLGRAERQQIYVDAQRIIAVEAPVVSLYVNDQTSAWRIVVRGYEVHPTATTLSLRETWLAE